MNIDYTHIPDRPGVYYMRDAKGRILYIGKAANLKRRVSSYFLRPHDTRIQTMVGNIRRITFEETDTALEALILESARIKEYAPPFNVREKDDKSFLHVIVTKERFPRILLVRGKEMKDIPHTKHYGPFTSASQLREALRIVRRIFPWHTHTSLPATGSRRRPCLEYEMGLCPGTCADAITAGEYARTIRNLKLFFEGKKTRVLAALRRDMRAASTSRDFEKADTFKKRIFALQHIRDVAFIADNSVRGGEEGHAPYRIEGYDISNIGGLSAVGAMVVFADAAPDKAEYRKFKIRTISQPDDVGMLKEVIMRRFGNAWRMPDLILIDGGTPQVRAAERTLAALGISVPVVGIAKGPTRKKNDIIGKIPEGVKQETLIRVRDEAHRFAVAYHKKVRHARFFG